MRDLSTVTVGEFFVIEGFSYGNTYSPDGSLIRTGVCLDVGMPVIVTDISGLNEEGVRFFELLTPSGFVRVFAGPRRWKSIFGDQ